MARAKKRVSRKAAVVARQGVSPSARVIVTPRKPAVKTVRHVTLWTPKAESARQGDSPSKRTGAPAVPTNKKLTGEKRSQLKLDVREPDRSSRTRDRNFKRCKKRPDSKRARSMVGKSGAGAKRFVPWC